MLLLKDMICGKLKLRQVAFWLTIMKYCSCCGMSWNNYFNEEDLTDEPEIYWRSVYEYKSCEEEAIIYYLDGTKRKRMMWILRKLLSLNYINNQPTESKSYNLGFTFLFALRIIILWRTISLLEIITIKRKGMILWKM